MRSMLDLTQNRYSSQWRADNAYERTEWELLIPLGLFYDGDLGQADWYKTEAEAQKDKRKIIGYIKSDYDYVIKAMEEDVKKAKSEEVKKDVLARLERTKKERDSDLRKLEAMQIKGPK